MKKHPLYIVIIALAVFAAGPVLAKDYTNEPMVSAPTQDGTDLIVGDNLMQSVAGEPCTEANAWVRYHDRQGDPWSRLKKEGKNWRIVNGMDQDVHPYVGDPKTAYKPYTNFVKIENIYGYPPEYVKCRGEGGQGICPRKNSNGAKNKPCHQ